MNSAKVTVIRHTSGFLITQSRNQFRVKSTRRKDKVQSEGTK